MNKFTIETSWDDGCHSDFIIADMLEEYGLVGTFYIPNCSELNADGILELSRGFEIGGHTVSHCTDMKELDDETLKKEIEYNKECLEKLINRKITKFCYPRGRWDDRIVEAVRNAGYTYARTTMVKNIEHPIDMLKVSTTIHVYPYRKEYNGQDWLELAKELFVKARNKNSYFHVFGHGWEVLKYRQFDRLRELFKFIKDNR